MSSFEQIVKPFVPVQVTPTSPGFAAPPKLPFTGDPVVIEIGKSGSGKNVGYSYSAQMSLYMTAQQREEKKAAPTP